jgi:hypothetical protein
MAVDHIFIHKKFLSAPEVQRLVPDADAASPWL